MFYNRYPYTDYSQLNLDWFLSEFKQLKEDWETTSGQWDQMQLNFQSLESTVQSFTTFVENYFENLDVQDEINTKLDQMAQDGTLADLLAPLVDDKLPDVVDDKLGAVVTDQLPNVVTDQLPGVVSDQISDAVAPEVPAAVTDWLEDNVNPVGSAVTIDTSLTIAGSAADAKVVGDRFALDEKKFNDLIPVKGNRIPYAVDEYYYHSYWYESGGSIRKNSNNSYSAYKIPITPGTTKIYFKESSYSFIINASGTILAGVNSTPATEYDLTGLVDPAYICYTDYMLSADKMFVSENIPIDIQINEIQTEKYDHNLVSKKTITPDNPMMTFPVKYANSVFQNMVMSVCYDFTTFYPLEIGLMKDYGTRPFKLNISATDITYTLPYGSTYTSAHGLTLSNNIQVIVTADDKDNFTVALTSNGNRYERTWAFRSLWLVRPYMIVNNTTADVTMSWMFNTIKKDIWAFGDSYFTYDQTRWTYHLCQAGYQNNCLLNAYSGCNSADAFTAFKDLLNIDKPKYVFWCMGMNDGSDTASDPSVSWKTYLDQLLEICEQYDIIPVLATIPTVPTVDNEQKNAFVRSSGYQYVDFAKAVGAQSDGTWYSGMISGDNVHPAAPGGLAQYNAVINEFPQIIIK